MKQLFFSIFIIFSFTVISCQKNDNITEIKEKPTAQQRSSGFIVVTEDEYIRLTQSEQEIVGYVRAAINALEGFDTQTANYTATISLFKNQPNFNNMAISTSVGGGVLEKGGTCDICSYGSAVSCIKAIKAHIDANGSVTVSVSKDTNGCYHVSY